MFHLINNIYDIYNNIYIKDIKQNISEYVLSKEQSQFIYKISYLFIFTTVYQLLRKQYLLALQIFILHLTSIMYWRKPKWKSFTRKIDMGYISVMLIFSISYCIYNKCCYTYITLSIIACIFWLISNYFYNKHYYWRSTYCHSLVHIISNFSLLCFTY